MNVQIQHRPPPLSPTSYLNLTPMRHTSGDRSVSIIPSKFSTPDFILRDSSKLLQLAEKIQTRKIPSSKHYQNGNRHSPIQHNYTPRINKEDVLSPATTVNSISGIKSAKITTVFGSGAKNGTNYGDEPRTPNSRKSKLYASFSGKKLQIKSDPAKTNIEHLVNFRNPNPATDVSKNVANMTPTSEAIVGHNDNSNFVTPLETRHASFHDRSKLSNAFGPRKKLFQSSNRKLNHVVPPVVPVPVPEVIDLLQDPNGDSDYWPLSEDGVIIVDDLMDCQNVVESRRLSVNKIPSTCATLSVVNSTVHVEPSLNPTSAPAQLGPILKHISMTCVNSDSSSDCDSFVSLRQGHHVDVKHQSHGYENITVSLNPANPPPVISRKNVPLCDGKLVPTPSLRFSNHFHDGESIAVATPPSFELPPEERLTQIVHVNNIENRDYDYGFPANESIASSFHCEGVQTQTLASVSTAPSNQRPSLRRISHPKISSAQIIPLSRKSSFPPQEEIPAAKFTTFFTTAAITSSAPMSTKPQYENGIGFPNDGSSEWTTTQKSFTTKSPSSSNESKRRIEIDREYYNYCENLSEKNPHVFSHSQIFNDGKSRSRNVQLCPVSVLLMRGKSKSECKLPQNSIASAVFASTSYHGGTSDGNPKFFCNNRNRKTCPEDEPYVEERKRSYSLPKSFMSERNQNLQNVLPSLLNRDDYEFERLESRRSCFFPAAGTGGASASTESNISYSTGAPSAAMTSTNTNGKFEKSQANLQTVKRLHQPDDRPLSLDVAHRKAWMRFYRDNEISKVTNGNSNAKANSNLANGLAARLSTKSTSHLHQLDQLEKSQEPLPGTSHKTSLVVDAKNPKSTTLFQRFSKTFSLRFGNLKDKDKSVNPKKKSKEVGSTPDLLSRVDSGDNRSSGKFRNATNNIKTVRSDKCQSSDSGIQLMDEKPYQASFRKISKSENSNLIEGDSAIPRSSIGCTIVERTSELGRNKLSLVEFPNQLWDSPNNTETESSGSGSGGSSHEGSQKLDDDGFVSNEDETDNNHPIQSQLCVSEIQSASEKSAQSSTTSANANNYHSLPLKYSRERKLALLEKHRQMKEEPIRAKVIREMVTTEQNYLKTLNDIIQGYLMPCRAEPTLFTPTVVANIFANIEDLLKFHIKFFDSLMKSIDQQDWSQSNIGHVFTLWVGEFDLYSDYCCLNPMSMATVRQLTLNPQYEKFFEACRRLQLMDKLPLHGFLLRPIQRICQYHLQLSELLKQTDETHPDYPAVVCALNAMKMVATRVNDTQREFDRLQEIVRLETCIEGWEGPDLVNKNAIILQRGDLVKMGEGEKHKEVFVVLLNRELLICKRDSLRKGALTFNLRIDFDSSVWINIDSNEEDECFGMVHNSWRIYNPLKSSWILFTCSSPSEKRSWISSLEQTSKKYTFDAKMIEMAKLTTIQLIQTDAQLSQGLTNGTINRNRKTRKSGSKSNLIDSDAMLIEVSKLKKTVPNLTTSKFYV